MVRIRIGSGTGSNAMAISGGRYYGGGANILHLHYYMLFSVSQPASYKDAADRYPAAIYVYAARPGLYAVTDFQEAEREYFTTRSLAV